MSTGGRTLTDTSRHSIPRAVIPLCCISKHDARISLRIRSSLGRKHLSIGSMLKWRQQGRSLPSKRWLRYHLLHERGIYPKLQVTGLRHELWILCSSWCSQTWNPDEEPLVERAVKSQHLNRILVYRVDNSTRAAVTKNRSNANRDIIPPARL
jgi:hypothetical protein